MQGNGSRAWSNLRDSGDHQRGEDPGLSCPCGHDGDVTPRPGTGLSAHPVTGLGVGSSGSAGRFGVGKQGTHPARGSTRGSSFAPAHAGTGVGHLEHPPPSTPPALRGLPAVSEGSRRMPRVCLSSGCDLSAGLVALAELSPGTAGPSSPGARRLRDHMSPLFPAFVSSPAPRSRVWGEPPHPRASEHTQRCSNRIICPIYPPRGGLRKVSGYG